MTAAERLSLLSGVSGVAASDMLKRIGQGATAGAALVNYSGLSSGGAYEHLLHDVDVGFIFAPSGAGPSIRLASGVRSADCDGQRSVMGGGDRSGAIREDQGRVDLVDSVRHVASGVSARPGAACSSRVLSMSGRRFK